MPSTNASTDVSMSSVHLDAIRGGAAVVVFLGHTRDLYFSSLSRKNDREVATSAKQNLPTRPATPVEQKITVGNESVMIFFVLSGYLVGGGVIKALKRNRWSWKNYLIKRLTRLWVVLIPALLLGVAFDFAGLHFFSNRGSIYTAPPQQMVVYDIPSRLTVQVIAENALFLQNILVGPAGSNDSLWSLANEFWYYIAFPVLLLALIKNQRTLLRCTYFVLFFGIVLLVGKAIGLLFFIWVLGGLLSAVPLMIPRRTARFLFFPMALLLPVVFVAVRRATLPMYLAQWIVALFSALAIYVALHQTEKARNGIYHSLAGFFSRISYTLYLVHLPLAVFICACINNPWHRWDKSPRNLAVYLGMNAGILLFSYFFYLAFEANTDKVRGALSHLLMKEKYLPESAASPR
jgi:peptidoglycan/LPS O-acetylase OafA/YrhL